MFCTPMNLLHFSVFPSIAQVLDLYCLWYFITIINGEEISSKVLLTRKCFIFGKESSRFHKQTRLLGKGWELELFSILVIFQINYPSVAYPTFSFIEENSQIIFVQSWFHCSDVDESSVVFDFEIIFRSIWRSVHLWSDLACKVNDDFNKRSCWKKTLKQEY